MLRASKTRRIIRPVTPAPVFHVEHPPAPVPIQPTSEQDSAVGRDELMALRARLIKEEHSAGEIARTLEAKLSDGCGDPLAARVLGEAYLRPAKVIKPPHNVRATRCFQAARAGSHGERD